jgi:hypothetical protein
MPPVTSACPDDADDRREQVEPGRTHGLHEVEHGAIDLTQRTDVDQGTQRDEAHREERDADQR